MEYVEKWLAMQKIDYGKIVVVEPDKTKGHLDYDVFIDDSPLNAIDAADRDKTALVYDQPWNRHLDQRDNLLRIRDLSEAASRIRSMLKFKE